MNFRLGDGRVHLRWFFFAHRQSVQIGHVLRRGGLEAEILFASTAKAIRVVEIRPLCLQHADGGTVSLDLCLLGHKIMLEILYFIFKHEQSSAHGNGQRQPRQIRGSHARPPGIAVSKGAVVRSAMRKCAERARGLPAVSRSVGAMGRRDNGLKVAVVGAAPRLAGV